MITSAVVVGMTNPPKPPHVVAFHAPPAFQLPPLVEGKKFAANRLQAPHIVTNPIKTKIRRDFAAVEKLVSLMAELE